MSKKKNKKLRLSRIGKKKYPFGTIEINHSAGIWDIEINFNESHYIFDSTITYPGKYDNELELEYPEEVEKIVLLLRPE